LNTLFARLSFALLAIVMVAGGALFYVNLLSPRNSHEEITQRLNESIAMYVTGQSQLIEDGVANQQALANLAEQAMVINPTVEIYLLDTQGRILGNGEPANLRTDAVELAPVRRLLAGEAHLPLRGTDPRSDREKVFSAWPVMQGETLQGYLYAVLGGQKYDALVDSVRGSYVQQQSLGALLAILVIAFLVGLLVFNLLTRRLVNLTRQVRRFSESDFDPAFADTLLNASNASSQASPHRQSGFIGKMAAGDKAPVGTNAGALLNHGDEITQLHTAFSHMAARISQQIDALKETDRLRRELISNVSHDLRTPLSSLHGYIETLLIKNEELNAAERRQYLEITRKHSKRLEQLISDLFELSKLEAAAITPQLEQFSLAELLQDVTQEFVLQADRKQIALRIEGEPGNSIVRADISLVQRVLENLLRNAIHHTPQGGSVTVRIDPRPDCVEVSVADTGCGIAEEDLDRVFDRFYRSEENHKLADDSAGLGLAIVQKILDLHGSRITVSSKLNAGTTFAFNLPGAQAA
jgi:signal transduction histidine kinase